MPALHRPDKDRQGRRCISQSFCCHKRQFDEQPLAALERAALKSAHHSAGSATAALARILFACRIVPRPSGVGPMRDYYPFVTRIVAGLDSNTGESRRVLSGRARAALCEQLRGVSPPLTDSEITRERLSLEAAIRRFEAEAIRRPRGTPRDATTAAASS